MTKQQREALGDWLIVFGAAVLLLSLFLTWSHQFSPAFLSQFGGSDLLRGVPHDPTAWQVYSAADVLLALLAALLLGVALFGNRAARVGALALTALALGFTVRAVSTPPSNVGQIFNPSQSVPNYYPNDPTAGVGETVALVALLFAGAGLCVTFTAD